MAREQDGDQVTWEVNPGGTEGGRRPTGVPPGEAGVGQLPPGDAGALAQKVQMIFEDEALASRLSQRERDLARERHDEKKVVASVLGAYQEICLSR